MGLGERLGLDKESIGSVEDLITTILLPIRYGSVTFSLGRELDLGGKISMLPSIGSGVLFANDSSYMQVHGQIHLYFNFNDRWSLGLIPSFKYNSLNPFYTINLGVRFALK